MAASEGERPGMRKTTAEPGLQERKEQEMAITALSRVLDEVKRLTLDEQRQLREAIDQLLSPLLRRRRKNSSSGSWWKRGSWTKSRALPVPVNPSGNGNRLT